MGLFGVEIYTSRTTLFLVWTGRLKVLVLQIRNLDCSATAAAFPSSAQVKWCFPVRRVRKQLGIDTDPWHWIFLLCFISFYSLANKVLGYFIVSGAWIQFPELSCCYFYGRLVPSVHSAVLRCSRNTFCHVKLLYGNFMVFGVYS